MASYAAALFPTSGVTSLGGAYAGLIGAFDPVLLAYHCELGWTGWPPPGMAVEQLFGPGAGFNAAFVPGVAIPTVTCSVFDLSPGQFFYGQVHLWPRKTIELGRLLSAASQQYELHNAHDVPVVVQSVGNPAAPNVALPSLPAAPFTIPPHSSVLASDGSLLKATVLATGPIEVDAPITFTLDTGEVVGFELLGERVPLLEAEADGDVVEKLLFDTAVIRTPGGQEQRVSTRAVPRQQFELTFSLLTSQKERQRLLSMLFSRQAATIGLPLWHESLFLTAAVSAGATSIPVGDTSATDWRVGGIVALRKAGAAGYEALPIASITGTTIELSEPTTLSYAAGDAAAPLRFVQLTTDLSGSRPPSGLENVQALALCVDNATGAPTGDTSGYSSFGGRLFLDDLNLVFSESMREGWRQSLVQFDPASGLPFQASDEATHLHAFELSFSCHSRAELWKFRRLLYALRGRAVSFWAPVRADDLIATQNLASGASTITVENVGYANFVAAKQPRATFRITFADGTALIRSITTAAVLSSAEEQLTLDASWPANRTVSEIARVEWLELVRLDSDEIDIHHTDLGLAEATVAAVGVRDP